MQSLMGTYFLYRSGDEGIRDEYLRPALAGERLGTICFTEAGVPEAISRRSRRGRPSGTATIGSSRVRRPGSRPRRSRTSSRCSPRPRTTRSRRPRAAGHSGTDRGRNIPKMGVRASVTSEVFLNDCRVPGRFLLAEEGRGREVLEEILEKIRLMTGALAVGAGRGALEAALAYAGQRAQFGRPIKAFQAIKMRLAEMATELEAARQLVHYGAWRDDSGLPSRKEAAMAKLFASEAGLKVCDGAVACARLVRLREEYPVERHLRDVRFTLIGGGTSEILKLVIAKEICA